MALFDACECVLVKRIVTASELSIMRVSKQRVVPQSGQHLSLVHKSNTPLVHKTSNEGALRRQLQEEIDRLAILIQEVNRQSAKVQAVADAIGDKTLLNAAQ